MGVFVNNLLLPWRVFTSIVWCAYLFAFETIFRSSSSFFFSDPGELGVGSFEWLAAPVAAGTTVP